MKSISLSLALILYFSTSYILLAQNPLDQYEWKNRILLVFVESQENNEYQVQKEVWLLDKAGFQERDLLIFEIVSDIAPNFSNEDIQFLKNTYLPQHPFVLILIGKDGTEKLRSEQLLSNEKLFEIIDAMPMRKQEIKN